MANWRIINDTAANRMPGFQSFGFAVGHPSHPSTNIKKRTHYDMSTSDLINDQHGSNEDLMDYFKEEHHESNYPVRTLLQYITLHAFSKCMHA